MLLRSGKYKGTGERSIMSSDNESVNLPAELLSNLLGLSLEELKEHERVEELLRHRLAPAGSTGSPGGSTQGTFGSSGQPDEAAGARGEGPREAPRPTWSPASLPMPKYEGFEDKKTPAQFISECERYARSQGFEPAVLLERAMLTALERSAYEWWDFTKGFTDWKTFCKALQAEFGAANYKEMLRREMEARTQAPQEPLASYIRKMYGYFQQLDDVTEADMVRRTVAQMHPDCHRLLHGRTFSTFTELAEAAPQVQAALLQERLYRPPPPAEWSIEPSLAWGGTGGARAPPGATPRPAGQDRAPPVAAHVAWQPPAAPAREGYERVGLGALDPYMANHMPGWAFQGFGGCGGEVMQPQQQPHYNSGANHTRKAYKEKRRNNDNYSGAAEGTRREQPPQRRDVCWECGQVGHIARHCPVLKNARK